MSVGVECVWWCSSIVLAHCSTPRDIYQSFSWTSRNLQSSNTGTSTTLHGQLRATYNYLAIVTSISSTTNISGLFEESCCILKYLPPFSHFCYFQFLRSREGFAHCKAKMHGQSEQDLFRPNQKSFLMKLADLSVFPKTIIPCPEGKNEVLYRIHSDEPRINTPVKMAKLIDLQSRVFRFRSNSTLLCKWVERGESS